MVVLSTEQVASGWKAAPPYQSNDGRATLTAQGPLYPRALNPKTPDGFRCVSMIATLTTEFDKVGRLSLTYRSIRPGTDVQTVTVSSMEL